MKNFLACVPVLALALLATGCAVDASDPDQEGVAAEPAVAVSVITTNADGTTAVREMSWSRAQFRAALRARVQEAEERGQIIDHATLGLPEEEVAAPSGSEKVGEAEGAISLDQGCAGSSLWISDNTAWSGTVNMICYAGTGTISLPSTWAGHYYNPTGITPLSIWPGTQSGALYYISPSCDAGCNWSYTGGAYRSNLGSATYMYSTYSYLVYQY